MMGISTTKSDKNIIMSYPLLMRMFEWCKEDACSDVALHRVLEKIIAFSDGINPLNMDCYECIISDANEGECDKDEACDEYASEEDLCNAYELGQNQAENGMDLSNDMTKAAGYMITANKDNGYGASNAEIEQFCQGYEDLDSNNCLMTIQCDDSDEEPYLEPCEISCQPQCEEPCDDYAKEIEEILKNCL